MAEVTFRYWAAARAAAGREQEVFAADSVAGALASARAAHPGEEFDRVLSLCSLLRDGHRVRADELDEPLSGQVLLEALPPFAGG